MDTEKTEKDFAARMKTAIEPTRGVDDRELRNAFAARLKQVAAQPDVVPIEFNGNRIEVRRGGTLLGAAMKNGVRDVSRRGRIGRGQFDSDERDREILAAMASLGKSADAAGVPGAREWA